MKKPRFMIFLFLMFFTSTCFAAGDLFSEANAKYKAGDYPAAAVLYEQIVSAQQPQASVQYNLGNALFRSGKKGLALLAYERASLLDPRDSDIEWNKTVLKNALKDHIVDESGNVFVSSFQKILGWITMDEIAVILVILLTGLFLIAAVNFIFHRSKPLTSGIGGFLVFLSILTGGIFYGKWLLIKDPRVVVLAAEASARYGPSEKETKAFVLHEGASAVLRDQTEDWYYIVLPDNNTGWIQKKSCEII